MKTEKLEQMVKSAGYGIELPPRHTKERFQMLRLVEHVYSLGCKAGLRDGQKLEQMIQEWENEIK